MRRTKEASLNCFRAAVKLLFIYRQPLVKASQIDSVSRSARIRLCFEDRKNLEDVAKIGPI